MSRRGCSMALVLAGVAWMLGPLGVSPSAAQPPDDGAEITGRGDTGCVWGSADCNRCAVDVVGQIERLAYEPWSRVTYHSGAGRRLEGMSAEMLPLVTRGKPRNKGHVQGFNRLPGLGANDWVVASVSSHDPTHPGRPAGLLLARIEGAGGLAGTPLREGDDPDVFWVEGQVPGGPKPPEVRSSRAFHPIRATKHPGGFQRIGRVVAVANYCNGPDDDECSVPRRTAFVDFVEIAPGPAGTLASPRRIGRLLLGDVGGWLRPRRKAFYAAIARQDNGRYVLMVNRSDLNVMQFFVSSSSTLDAATAWHPRGTRRFSRRIQFLPSFVTVFQNMNFVTDCSTGEMFALGFRQKGPAWMGENRIRLFRVFPKGRNLGLEKLAEVKLAEPDDACELKGGGGAYVGPGGQIVIYCSQGRSREKQPSAFFPERDDQDPTLLNFSEYVAPPPSSCGDGRLAPESEQCDDGNRFDGFCRSDGRACANPGGSCAGGGLCDFDGCSRYCGGTSSLRCAPDETCRTNADCGDPNRVCEDGCCVFEGPD